MGLSRIVCKWRGHKLEPIHWQGSLDEDGNQYGIVLRKSVVCCERCGAEFYVHVEENKIQICG